MTPSSIIKEYQVFNRNNVNKISQLILIPIIIVTISIIINLINFKIFNEFFFMTLFYLIFSFYINSFVGLIISVPLIANWIVCYYFAGNLIKQKNVNDCLSFMIILLIGEITLINFIYLISEGSHLIKNLKIVRLIVIAPIVLIIKLYSIK